MQHNKFLTAIFLFFFYTVSFATIQQSHYWTDVDFYGNIFHHKKWLYELNLQDRFNARKNRDELNVVTGGVGYEYLPNLSFWLGYKWVSNNHIIGIKQENRIWEQIIWQIINSKSINLSSRTRLEQRKLTGQPQWGSRLREKGTLAFPMIINKKLIPVIYDEIFLNLNNPTWVKSKTLNQNRLFLGFNIISSKNTYFQIGYLNQYSFTHPVNVNNQILSISFYVKT